MLCRRLVILAVALLPGLPALPTTAGAQSLPTVGNLDCNGYSRIQKPLRPQASCADFRSPDGGRGYDNGHYIGHDEPSIGFISTAPRSGHDIQWKIALPIERPLPATRSFENFVTFWFSMALCDPRSFPRGKCIPDSDRNDPNLAGSALLELQLYPPGFPPLISQISCDLRRWCAALNIDSFAVLNNGEPNPNCTEPVNFALIQRDGVPSGPPGPASATTATFTPNAKTLLMNPGDQLRITIKDTRSGLLTRIEDLSTGQKGFMVASAENGFQGLDPNTCAPRRFDFHPEFATAKFGNFVPWAALQANINFAMEIGHFTPGRRGDGDKDDSPCFPGPTVAGCISRNGDVDFDGSSYRADWPDGSTRHATSLAIRSVAGGGIGPLSASAGGSYSQPYAVVQFETEAAASEASCRPDGIGCTFPPAPARFYPYYSLQSSRSLDGHPIACALRFGNLRGPGYDDLGRQAQYGATNLAWFAGQNSSGPIPNPCPPRP